MGSAGSSGSILIGVDVERKLGLGLGEQEARDAGAVNAEGGCEGEGDPGVYSPRRELVASAADRGDVAGCGAAWRSA